MMIKRIVIKNKCLGFQIIVDTKLLKKSTSLLEKLVIINRIINL